MPFIDIQILDTLDIQSGDGTIVEVYSNNIQQKLSQIDYTNKEIIFIGHSLGGAAMLLAAASSKITVNKMILIDPVDTGM